MPKVIDIDPTEDILGHTDKSSSAEIVAKETKIENNAELYINIAAWKSSCH